MRKLLTLGGALAVFAGLSMAADFTGRLVDATCHSTQQTKPAGQSAQPSDTKETCDVTAATSSFAIEVGGKVYNLDASGNSKATNAMKSRADRSANPSSSTTSGAVNAKVTGTMEGDTIKVDSITVQ
jgi:hypothetical protein